LITTKVYDSVFAQNQLLSGNFEDTKGIIRSWSIEEEQTIQWSNNHPQNVTQETKIPLIQMYMYGNKDKYYITLTLYQTSIVITQ